MKVALNNLTKEIYFPTVQALPNPIPKNMMERLKAFFRDKRNYEIKRDYVLWVPYLSKFVFIPNFFIYDTASVPKILNSVFNPSGILLLGSLPHDFGYRYEGLLLVNPISGEVYFQGYSKSELDIIFKTLCAWESGLKLAPATATLGLTVSGFFSWNMNRKNNLNIQQDFPIVFAD